jgi:hypothetical protein
VFSIFSGEQMKAVREGTRFRFFGARSWRLAVAAVLLGVVAACSSSEASGPNGRPSGKWVGSMVSGTFTLSLELVLVEDASGKVTGNGFISTAIGGVTNANAALTATGAFVAPDLSVNLASPGFSTLNLTGTISGDSFNARLNGSGLDNETMVLARQ